MVGDAVATGRAAVQNVTKYVLMGASSNFGNMFSMAGATLILPFLPMLPIQILLNNLIYNVSEIAIPFDNVDAETVVKPIEVGHQPDRTLHDGFRSCELHLRFLNLLGHAEHISRR